MQQYMQKIFRYWGSELVRRRGTEEVPFRGFLQHTGSKSWQNMEKAFSPLGEIPRGQHTLVAPPELDIAIGDTLMLGEKAFEVRRVETVMYRDTPLYYWGLCVEKGGEDQWATRS